MRRYYDDDWMADFDDEDYTLLGNRFVHALRTREARRDYGAHDDGDWQHRPRKRVRPEPHRERLI